MPIVCQPPLARGGLVVALEENVPKATVPLQLAPVNVHGGLLVTATCGFQLLPVAGACRGGAETPRAATEPLPPPGDTRLSVALRQQCWHRRCLHWRVLSREWAPPASPAPSTQGTPSPRELRAPICVHRWLCSGTHYCWAATHPCLLPPGSVLSPSLLLSLLQAAFCLEAPGAAAWLCHCPAGSLAWCWPHKLASAFIRDRSLWPCCGHAGGSMLPKLLPASPLKPVLPKSALTTSLMRLNRP